MKIKLMLIGLGLLLSSSNLFPMAKYGNIPAVRRGIQARDFVTVQDAINQLGKAGRITPTQQKNLQAELVAARGAAPAQPAPPVTKPQIAQASEYKQLQAIMRAGITRANAQQFIDAYDKLQATAGNYSGTLPQAFRDARAVAPKALAPAPPPVTPPAADPDALVQGMNKFATDLQAFIRQASQQTGVVGQAAQQIKQAAAAA